MQLHGESSQSVSSQAMELPCRVVVSELLSSRYGVPDANRRSNSGEISSNRPEDWDLRKGGTDTVRLIDGSTIKLASSAQQSPPGAGWVLLLFAGDPDRGFEWTLYGMQPS